MTRPFEHEQVDEFTNNAPLCGFCTVYRAAVVIGPGDNLHWFCRDCLRRMRATLKAAEKALPPLPKQVVPREEP